MKVVFCWATISGYMAACWRAFAQQADVEPYVIAFQGGRSTAFNDGLMAGIPCRLLGEEERSDKRLIHRLVTEQQPDVVVVSGWFHPPYRRLPFHSSFSEVSFVMGMDTPWQETIRQQVARVVLQPYVQRMDHVVVTGERSAQYAQRLGAHPGRMMHGLYGVNVRDLSHALTQRRAAGWPRRFLFVGRFAEEKAVDVLINGYAQYRSRVASPWPLTCCGKGPLAPRLEHQLGIENRGFVQPADMHDVWAEAGAFVLPSRFDPWPLALVEATAAGLPVICTHACGSAVELIRDGYNGLVVPPEDPTALARALYRIHVSHEQLPAWGERAQQLAAPYSAEQWADRWARMAHELVHAKQASGRGKAL